MTQSFSLPTSHTTSTGVTIHHEDSGGAIILAQGGAIYLNATAWNELIAYGIARAELMGMHDEAPASAPLGREVSTGASR